MTASSPKLAGDNIGAVPTLGGGRSCGSLTSPVAPAALLALRTAAARVRGLCDRVPAGSARSELLAQIDDAIVDADTLQRLTDGLTALSGVDPLATEDAAPSPLASMVKPEPEPNTDVKPTVTQIVHNAVEDLPLERHRLLLCVFGLSDALPPEQVRFKTPGQQLQRLVMSCDHYLRCHPH